MTFFGQWDAFDSTLQREFDWVPLSYNNCPCKGSGFALHHRDLWVRCPFHGPGILHPESGEPAALNAGAMAAVDRKVFAAIAEELGMTNAFLTKSIEAHCGTVRWSDVEDRRRALDRYIESQRALTDGDGWKHAMWLRESLGDSYRDNAGESR